MSNRNNNFSSIISAFTIGVAVGAAATLYANKDTRDKMQKMFADWEKKGNKKWQKWQKSFEDLRNKAVKKIDEEVRKAQETKKQ